MILIGYSRAAAVASGPVFFDDLTTSNQVASYIAHGTPAPTLTYDGPNTELDVVNGGAWQGVATPALTVEVGKTYTVQFSAKFDGPNSALDSSAGSTVAGGNYGSLAIADRFSPGQTKTASYVATPTGTTMYVYVGVRGGAAGHSFALQDIAVTKNP